MLRVPMLHRRGHTYYARIHVPLDLQPAMKKREVWKSLRTSSLPEAQVLCLTVTAQMLKVFDSMRKRLRNRLLDQVLMEEGLHVSPSKRPDFLKALLQAHLAALKERVGGVSAGPTIGDLLERYLKERGLGSKSEEEVRSAFARFVAVVGNKPAQDVTKEDVRRHRVTYLPRQIEPSDPLLLASGPLILAPAL